MQNEKEELKREKDKSQTQVFEDKVINENLHMEVDRLRAQLTKGPSAPQNLSPSASEGQALVEALRAELDRERRRIRYLEQDKQSLLNQIQAEQQTRIEKKKHKLELEARLKTAEVEAQKSQEERVNLEMQIIDMKRTQNELLSKIRES